MTDHDFYCESVLSGRVAVRVVGESQDVLAFEHTDPAWETHIVVIPKRHVRRLIDVDEPMLIAEIFTVICRIIRAHDWAETGYKIITNGGVYQSTPHLHFHLVAGKPLDPTNPAQSGEMVV